MYSIVDHIKGRLDIRMALQQFTAADLSRLSGERGHICCPFHNDRTPSFFVDTRKNTWHCFGSCVTGGDVINLYATAQGIDNAEAIRQLCVLLGIAGTPLAQDKNRELHKARAEQVLVAIGRERLQKAHLDLCIVHRAMHRLAAEATPEEYEAGLYKLDAVKDKIANLIDHLEDEKDPNIFNAYIEAKEAIRKWQFLQTL